MGQYYRAFNLTKKLSVSSHDVKEEGEEWGSGSKLMEHGYLGNTFVGAIMELLKNEWRGDRIAWIGDYFEDGEIDGIPSWNTAEEEGEQGEYKEFIPKAAKVTKGFLNNHTLDISIDLSNCSLYEEGQVEKGWELSPLVMLTACGNGRGGGDYRGNFGFVGAWAGHEFSVTDIPEFKRVPFNFEMKLDAILAE